MGCRPRLAQSKFLGWMMIAVRSALFMRAVFIAPVFFIFLLLPTVAFGRSRLPPCPNDPTLFWDGCQGTLTYTDRGRACPADEAAQRYSDCSKYVGEFRKNERNGQGTLTYANGSKYVGEFKDGKPNGQGTSFATDGSFMFSGTFADGTFLETAADQQTIRMKNYGGVYVVPVRLNNTITLDAIVDSGALLTLCPRSFAPKL
jgi:hypothetical protein